ncbi:[F-actin]-monooxygenase MICAL3 [Holothuria leucospilota]|uniref:[F-actin]-monooxygenase MICAL3 n=1 Tax=Holothuria leucospilota TaxID=206669 RepID=A0A9Q1H7Z3_HOLLE|nr:[F-actin]-monooxygenase MICAL3 [Holothuria leucospilota]
MQGRSNMYGIKPPIIGRAAYVPPKQDFTDTVFNQFVKAQTLKGTLSAFFTLCEQIDVRQFENHHTFYQTLKDKVRSWKATALWSSLDQLVNREEYASGSICANKKVLIIGAGPCGLRTAIECALLGAKVVVIEKRENFTRNNVLHLWPFVIKDLRKLGAKVLYPKFCPGNIDHISIRRLQLILLKICLCLGIEVHCEVAFQDIVEPPEDQTEGLGWRAKFDPEDHPLSQIQFDVVIGADGRRNTLKGFERKKAGRALAIALTFNFKNYNSSAEARVQEIGGISYQFRQDFFKEMNQKLGITLENLVYYKDETHYFVVTAKKSSLMKKDVIIEDKPTIAELLAPSNVNYDKLKAYALEIATFSTELPNYDFEINHHNMPDVAMFDFTSIHLACHSAFVRNKHGHELLHCLVGDSLLQPFWPQGTGCGRGFLSSLDAAWMIREWSLGERDTLDILAERETLYILLPNTTPVTLSKDLDSYCLHPGTRYKLLKNETQVKTEEVKHLYNPEEHASEERIKRKFEDPWDSVVANSNLTRSGSREDMLSEQSPSDDYLEQSRSRNQEVNNKDNSLSKGFGSTKEEVIGVSGSTDGGYNSMMEASGSKGEEVNCTYPEEEERDILAGKTGSSDQEVSSIHDVASEADCNVSGQRSEPVNEEIHGLDVSTETDENSLVEGTGSVDSEVSSIRDATSKVNCNVLDQRSEPVNEDNNGLNVSTEMEKSSLVEGSGSVDSKVSSIYDPTCVSNSDDPEQRSDPLNKVDSGIYVGTEGGEENHVDEVNGSLNSKVNSIHDVTMEGNLNVLEQRGESAIKDIYGVCISTEEGDDNTFTETSQTEDQEVSGLSDNTEEK